MALSNKTKKGLRDSQKDANGQGWAYYHGAIHYFFMARYSACHKVSRMRLELGTLEQAQTRNPESRICPLCRLNRVSREAQNE